MSTCDSVLTEVHELRHVTYLHALISYIRGRAAVRHIAIVLTDIEIMMSLMIGGNKHFASRLKIRTSLQLYSTS